MSEKETFRVSIIYGNFMLKESNFSVIFEKNSILFNILLMANCIFSGLFIGISIQAHGYYTTLPYHVLLSIARYAGIYRHAAGPCGSDIGTSI